MKIGFISNFCPVSFTKPEGGGISRSLVNKIIQLYPFTQQVHLVSFHNIDTRGFDKISTVNLSDNFLRFLNRFRRFAFFRILSYIYKGYLVNKYFKNNYFLKDFSFEVDDCEGLGMFISNNVNYHVRVHGNNFLYGNLVYKGLNRVVFAFIDKLTILNAKVLSFPSVYTEFSTQNKVDLSNKKIFNNLNFIDYKECLIPKLNSNTIEYIITDRLDKLKGGDFLLKSIVALTEIYNYDVILKFSFFGDVRLSNYNDLKSRIRSNPKVICEFYGNNGYNHIQNCLENSQYFIGTSQTETFSYTMFESMRLGLPLILNNDHVYKEFSSSVSLKFKYGDCDSFIKAIFESILIYQSEKYTELVSKTHANFLKVYNSKLVLDKELEIFNENNFN